MRNWRRVLSIAAGLAFLVAAYFMWENGNRAPDYVAIAQEGYREYPPNLSGTKAVGDEPQAFETNKQWLMSNNQNELDAAIAYFEKEKTTSPEAAYYLGHGYWQKGDYEKSLLNFDEFLSQSDRSHPLFAAAEYYKALPLVMLGEIEEAKAYINAKKEGHPFQKPFEKLLEKMDKG
jgi:tetratricopeptide (TPR) repeat protein